LERLADRPSWNAFRFAVDYSDAEIAVYQQIISRKQGSYSWNNNFWVIFTTGFVAALVTALVAAGTGIVDVRNGDVVAVLVFAGFWIGVWAPDFLFKRKRQKALQEHRDTFRARLQNASILVTASGIVTRAAGARSFYSRSAIMAATKERGLLLLWTTTHAAIIVPLRLLDPAQQAQLLSFDGKPNGSEVTG
jgi:hypothetical protein